MTKHCARCGGEFEGGTLLCYGCQLAVIREIRKDARDREYLLREEDPE